MRLRCGDVRGTLLVVSAASFMTPFMSSSVSVAMPMIGAEFSLDAVTLGWVASSYLLAAAAFLLPFGRLADIHGRRRVFLAGLVVHTLASAAAAASTEVYFSSPCGHCRGWAEPWCSQLPSPSSFPSRLRSNEGVCWASTSRQCIWDSPPVRFSAGY